MLALKPLTMVGFAPPLVKYKGKAFDSLGGKRSFFYLLKADKGFRSFPLYASPIALAYKEVKVNLDRFSVSTLKVNTKGRANPSLQLDYHRIYSKGKRIASRIAMRFLSLSLAFEPVF